MGLRTRDINVTHTHVENQHTGILGRTTRDTSSGDFTPSDIIPSNILPGGSYPQIFTPIHPLWNMVCFSLPYEQNLVDTLYYMFNPQGLDVGFIDKSEYLADIFHIMKNNEGIFYWPAFTFNGIGNLIPGQGYQLRVKDSYILGSSPGNLGGNYFKVPLLGDNDTNIAKDYLSYLNATNGINITIEVELGGIGARHDWSMIGFTRIIPQPARDAVHSLFFPTGIAPPYYGSLGTHNTAVGSKDRDLLPYIHIFKNNEGEFYWPSFSFNGIGNVEPGQGYQMRIKDDAPLHLLDGYDSSTGNITLSWPPDDLSSLNILPLIDRPNTV